MFPTRPAVLVATLAALLASACGSTSATVPNPRTGGIDLLTMAGPTCPVQRQGQPPCERPISAVVVVRDGRGAAVTTVQTGADGKAHVPLLPGTYNVAPQRIVSGPPSVPAAVDVTVQANAWAPVRFDYDTGMR